MEKEILQEGYYVDAHSTAKPEGKPLSEITQNLYEAIKCDYAHLNDKSQLYESDMHEHISEAVVKSLVDFYKAMHRFITQPK